MLPQIILIALALIGIGIAMAEDGQPKTGHESAGWTIFGVALEFWLLYWGGFFDCFFGG